MLGKELKTKFPQPAPSWRLSFDDADISLQ